MNRNVYDEQRALQLVPLLRSITNEIQERALWIERLEHRLDVVTRATRAPKRTETLREIEANLAENRRQLRIAKRELERLGCALDEDHPLRVLIPGTNGELDHGYAWTPTDATVHAT